MSNTIDWSALVGAFSLLAACVACALVAAAAAVVLPPYVRRYLSAD